MNYENIKETFSKIDFKTLTLIKDILDKEYKHKLNSNIQQSLSSKSKEALIKLIRDNYSECQYHSTIKLNQQYFSEEIDRENIPLLSYQYLSGVLWKTYFYK